jgi:hypothetical protein
MIPNILDRKPKILTLFQKYAIKLTEGAKNDENPG